MCTMDLLNNHQMDQQVEMLNRDQRTERTILTIIPNNLKKHCFNKSRPASVSSSLVSSSASLSQSLLTIKCEKVQENFKKISQKNLPSYQRKSFKLNLMSIRKVNKSLLVLLYLWTLASCPVRAFPTFLLSSSSSSLPESFRAFQSPKWEHFCSSRSMPETSSSPSNEMTETGNIIESMNRIKLACEIALNEVTHKIENYIKTVWNIQNGDLNKFLTTWSDKHFFWLTGLRRLPKKFNEPVPSNYFTKYIEEPKNLKIYQDDLLYIYERFQRLAIGLLLVEDHHNQTRDHSGYTDSKLREIENMFSTLQENVANVICALKHTLVLINNDIQLPIVDRSVVDEMYLDDINNKLHHWVILREYMNHLQFTEKAMDILKAHLEAPNK